MTNKLTIDHIESLAACPDVEFVHVTSNPSTRIDVKRVLRQLAQVMRENKRLRQAVSDVLPNLLAWDASLESSESYLRLREIANKDTPDVG